jgi:hypothetical protein
MHHTFIQKKAALKKAAQHKIVYFLPEELVIVSFMA